jgi:hypothetical protein
MLTWFAPQGVIIELGRGHARRNQSMRGLIVEESGDQVQCLIDTPKAIEYHGCDGFPDGEVPQLRVLLRRFVHDVANVRIPVEGWFLPNFGDSGQLQQNRHEPVERSKLENPGESMEKRSIFSLPAQPSPGVHQNWP